MKKGYKRLLIFEIILILFLILNSFFWNVLNNYSMLLFLLIILFSFYKLFGFEKDNHRYLKDFILETIILVITFLLLYYLLGIFMGFARTSYSFSFKTLINFIIPISLIIICKEILRYMITSKAEGNIIVRITTVILFILIDITSLIYNSNLTSNYSIFLFIAITLLPSISFNTSFSFITLKIGYKPLIVYSLILNLYIYLVPIIPNPNEYIYSIIYFCLPIIYLYRIFMIFEKERERRILEINHKYNFGPLIGSIIFITFVVYFTSGYFKYWAIAVASGSMENAIYKGDVVLIAKFENDLNTLKVGEIVAFRKNKIVVVHRLVNIVKDKNEYYFYTKGDNNPEPDNFVITEDMMIGRVKLKIPYIGKPTVWLNSL